MCWLRPIPCPFSLSNSSFPSSYQSDSVAVERQRSQFCLTFDYEIMNRVQNIVLDDVGLDIPAQSNLPYFWAYSLQQVTVCFLDVLEADFSCSQVSLVHAMTWYSKWSLWVVKKLTTQFSSLRNEKRFALQVFQLSMSNTTFSWWVFVLIHCSKKKTQDLIDSWQVPLPVANSVKSSVKSKTLTLCKQIKKYKLKNSAWGSFRKCCVESKDTSF